MKTTTDQQEAAWNRLKKPTLRRQYEHIKSWERRRDHRANFTAKVTRDAETGCWLWGGQVTYVSGRSYPITSFRPQPGEDRRQRSSFSWMVLEFFPELAAMTVHRTAPACGQRMCINPWHRVDGRVTRQTLTADGARAVYADKGHKDAQVVAQQHGISRDQVLAIWRGRNWRQATGAAPHVPGSSRRSYTAAEFDKVLELKGTGSSRKVAEQVGVHYKFVLGVWSGLRDRQSL